MHPQLTMSWSYRQCFVDRWEYIQSTESLVADFSDCGAVVYSKLPQWSILNLSQLWFISTVVSKYVAVFIAVLQTKLTETKGFSETKSKTIRPKTDIQNVNLYWYLCLIETCYHGEEWSNIKKQSSLILNMTRKSYTGSELITVVTK